MNEKREAVFDEAICRRNARILELETQLETMRGGFQTAESQMLQSIEWQATRIAELEAENLKLFGEAGNHCAAHHEVETLLKELEARWDEVKRLLTNRMNFEREEVTRRPEMAEGMKNALLNQATAFEFTLGLMARFEREKED